jgi:hypothetical protein
MAEERQKGDGNFVHQKSYAEQISKSGLRRRLAQAFAAQAILAIERHRQPHILIGAPAWS